LNIKEKTKPIIRFRNIDLHVDLIQVVVSKTIFSRIQYIQKRVLTLRTQNLLGGLK
jgi:hypothetical protein